MGTRKRPGLTPGQEFRTAAVDAEDGPLRTQTDGQGDEPTKQYESEAQLSQLELLRPFALDGIAQLTA